MNPESYCEYIDNNIIMPFFGKKDDSDVRNIPLEFILLFVDDARLKTIWSKEQDYIENLAIDIFKNGLKNPIELKSDLEGKICVTEGHHRIIACQQLKIKKIPTTLKTSRQRVTGYGRNISLFPKEIWEAINN